MAEVFLTELFGSNYGEVIASYGDTLSPEAIQETIADAIARMPEKTVQSGILLPNGPGGYSLPTSYQAPILQLTTSARRHGDPGKPHASVGPYRYQQSQAIALILLV
ncbi:hypothetical protein ACT4US_35845, partial [Bacillus sp. HC-Mk]